MVNRRSPRIVVATSVFTGIFLVLILASNTTAREDKKDTLLFRITLDNTQYPRNNPINLECFLENKGKDPVWVNSRFYISSKDVSEEDREVYLEITDPEGDQLAYTYSYPTGFPKTDYFRLLEPGESVGIEHPRDIRAYFNLSKPGTYRITGVYKNVFGSELGLDTYRGQLRSEPLEFTVNE